MGKLSVGEGKKERQHKTGGRAKNICAGHNAIQSVGQSRCLFFSMIIDIKSFMEINPNSHLKKKSQKQVGSFSFDSRLAWSLEGNRKALGVLWVRRAMHKLSYFHCYILKAVNSQLSDASCKGESKQTTGSRSVLPTVAG